MVLFRPERDLRDDPQTLKDPAGIGERSEKLIVGLQIINPNRYVGEGDRDMIYAATAAEVQTRRMAFLRKWRLKCRAVADSLKKAGQRLFAFTRLDPSQ